MTGAPRKAVAVVPQCHVIENATKRHDTASSHQPYEWERSGFQPVKVCSIQPLNRMQASITKLDSCVEKLNLYQMAKSILYRSAVRLKAYTQTQNAAYTRSVAAQTANPTDSRTCRHHQIHLQRTLAESPNKRRSPKERGRWIRHLTTGENLRKPRKPSPSNRAISKSGMTSTTVSEA